jgi:class 3 adenylate cyclase
MAARGTLTFLFSDVEESTSLLRRVGSDAFATLLDRQAALIAEACGARGGSVVDRQGDSCMLVFDSASEALVAAAQAQRALTEEQWPEPFHVRMGLHTGEATVVEGRYVGVAVHRAARICGLAAGGQVLVSATTREVATDALPSTLGFEELGRRKLKGLEGLERLFVLTGEAPESALDRRADVQPVQAPAVRLADADRERVGALLREHTVQGRLTLDEFSSRLDALYAARSDTELAAVLSDLPELPAEAPRRGKKRAWLITLFGSDQRRGPWRAPKRMLAFSLLGSPDLDFRHAAIDTDEVRITSVAIMGSLTAIVPAGVEVDLGGFCLVGGNDFVRGDEVPAMHGGPRLRIRCYTLFGGAAIKHVRGGDPDRPERSDPSRPASRR